MKIPAPGRMVDIGGRRLHVNVEGQGDPVVVLEAGAAATSLSWPLVKAQLVKAQLAGIGTVVTYDRAGLGWSDPGAGGYTALDSAKDLALLLEKIPVKGPVILAGHSFGGLVARVFEQQNPGRVAGLVLIDPVVRAGWRAMNPTLARGVMLSRRGARLARLGVVNAALKLLMSGSRFLPKLVGRVSAGQGAGVMERLTGEVRKIPQELWPAIAYHWSQPKSFQTMADTLESLPVSVKQLDENKTLGDLPVVVLSAATASAKDLEEHEHDARLSTRGEHIVVPGTGHWMQLDAPDAIAAAIRRVTALAGEF